MERKKFPKFLFSLIFFIAIVNTLAVTFSWYWRIPWFDMPMHFLGGLFVGSVALWFYSQSVERRYLRALLVSIGAVLMVGGLWEVFEFSVDTIVSVSEQNGIIDTLSDIIFDIIGGTMAVVYFIFKK